MPGARLIGRAHQGLVSFWEGPWCLGALRNKHPLPYPPLRLSMLPQDSTVQLLWMRQTLRDFGYNMSKVPLLCDNESAIRLVDNPVEHSRTKHIDIQHHFLRDHQQRGDIDIYHISSENQLADVFTKPLDEKRFCRLRSELNVLDSRNLD
jgi:hypothetical protein